MIGRLTVRSERKKSETGRRKKARLPNILAVPLEFYTRCPNQGHIQDQYLNGAIPIATKEEWNKAPKLSWRRVNSDSSSLDPNRIFEASYGVLRIGVHVQQDGLSFDTISFYLKFRKWLVPIRTSALPPWFAYYNCEAWGKLQELHLQRKAIRRVREAVPGDEITTCAKRIAEVIFARFLKSNNDLIGCRPKKKRRAKCGSKVSS